MSYGIRGKSMNTVDSWDIRSCNMDEKEDRIAVQISKQKKLNGRSYKEWVKSLVKAKGPDPPIQKESFLPQTDVKVVGPKDSRDNETTDTNISPSRSTPDRVDFRLRRIRYSGNAERSYSLDGATQNVKLDKSIIESQGNAAESKPQENGSGEECKSTITDFVEYWVPVRLSKIQIEQYCSSLFSNSMVLCSPYNTLKSLHEILVSTKKCCDHPYLVDRSLHTTLIEGVPQSEQLDAQIKLSGKLLLLYKALLEINKRGLRVLVLYQSLGGSEPITTGDILDDIIHEKFGRDSFVRIEGQIFHSRRQAVLDSFNDQTGGKFVCLMEIHACVPSIKLKSIDTVIFFNSDCDPMNDFKALQKINLDSQFERVKVFRLYSACTVEEKVLMLTKKGNPKGNPRNKKRSTYHELLTWCAYFLFQKLDNFHNASTTDTDSIVSHENSFVEEVFQELCIVLPNNDKSNVHIKNSFVFEVQKIGGVYSTNISLVGEVEYPLMDNFSVVEEMLIKEPPHVFWVNILEGRKPGWKYVSCQSPTEAGNTSCQTPSKTRRARNRCQSRDKERKLPAALSRTETPMVEESFLQTTPRASNMMEDIRAPETSRVTHTEVLQSACTALQVEMERLQKHKTEFSKQHNDKKLQARIECEREIDEIQKKYEVVLQNADMAFLKEKEALETRYNKVRMNKALAESSMQADPKNATLCQVTTRFVVEQTYQLLCPRPRASTVIEGEQVAEQAVEASPELHVSGGDGSGCLRVTAPHLRQQVRHSPPCTVPKQPSEHPGILYSPVSLQQGDIQGNRQTIPELTSGTCCR